MENTRMKNAKRNKKIKLHGIWRSNGFAFLFKIEKWNKDENPYELRLYVLLWEFNFSIKSNKKWQS